MPRNLAAGAYPAISRETRSRFTRTPVPPALYTSRQNNRELQLKLKIIASFRSALQIAAQLSKRFILRNLIYRPEDGNGLPHIVIALGFCKYLMASLQQ
jgi:hypothetical protein